jgi:hypothetical protein
VRLLETEPPRQKQHRTEAGQYAEDAAPAHDSAELTAKYGSDHRRQTGYQKQPREEDHQRSSGIEITGDGAGDHYPSRAGQTLDEPEHGEGCR